MIKDSYLTISKENLENLIEKPDVYIVYLKNKEKPWLCDKKYKYHENQDGTLTFKLATK